MVGAGGPSTIGSAVLGRRGQGRSGDPAVDGGQVEVVRYVGVEVLRYVGSLHARLDACLHVSLVLLCSSFVWWAEISNPRGGFIRTLILWG